LGTGIITGLLIGASSVLILTSYRLDKCYEKMILLETTIDEKNAQLSQLEKSLNKNKLLLQEVKVNLQCNGDDLDKLALQKHIKEKYSVLIGKDILSIDPDLAVGIIEGRILTVNNKEYRITVQKLILTRTLELWVTAQA